MRFSINHHVFRLCAVKLATSFLLCRQAWLAVSCFTDGDTSFRTYKQICSDAMPMHVYAGLVKSDWKQWVFRWPETRKALWPKIRLWRGNEWQGGGRAHRPCRSVILQEVGKVRWRTGMYCFMRYSGNFKQYTGWLKMREWKNREQIAGVENAGAVW